MLVYPIPKGCHGDRSKVEPPMMLIATVLLIATPVARVVVSIYAF